MPCITITVNPAPVPTPQFYISKIWTDKNEYTVGEEVILHAFVNNSGDAPGYADIVVKVDGVVVKTDKVYVLAGYHQEVAYSIPNLPAGSHELCINDKCTTVTVKEAAPPITPPVTPPVTPPAPALDIKAILILAATAVVAFSVLRR